MSDIVITDTEGKEITDEFLDEMGITDRTSFLKMVLDIVSQPPDEFDREVDRLILEGKQVVYYTDTIH
jgi:hypothetical protein